MEATLQFKTLEQANTFAINWTRRSFLGHTISSGTENVEVKVYEVTEELKAWIDAYVAKINGGA